MAFWLSGFPLSCLQYAWTSPGQVRPEQRDYPLLGRWALSWNSKSQILKSKHCFNLLLFCQRVISCILRVRKPFTCSISQGIPNPFLLEDSQAGFWWCQLIIQNSSALGRLSFGGRTLEDTPVFGKGMSVNHPFSPTMFSIFLKPGDGEATWSGWTGLRYIFHSALTA